MNHKLFSYGTLQLEKVQLESYGRKLKGSPDVLEKYKIEQLEIKDQEVVEKSRQKYHPIAIKTNNPNFYIKGIIFEISEAELSKTDQYEVKDYTRILETFQSGTKAWVYVQL